MSKGIDLVTYKIKLLCTFKSCHKLVFVLYYPLVAWNLDNHEGWDKK